MRGTTQTVLIAIVLLLAAVLLLSGNAKCGGVLGCGVEKIEIKDLCDPDTAFLAIPPVHSTVKIEGLLPISSPRRLVVVSGTITAYKAELDGDIHCCIEDGGAKMIVEFPDPDCPTVKRSSRYVQMRVSREWFLKNVGIPTAKLKKANVRAEFMGQQFMDRLHGQFGAAPNGCEIHGVLLAEKSNSR